MTKQHISKVLFTVSQGRRIHSGLKQAFHREALVSLFNMQAGRLLLVVTAIAHSIHPCIKSKVTVTEIDASIVIEISKAAIDISKDFCLVVQPLSMNRDSVDY